jgi:hypothetical protein
MERRSIDFNAAYARAARFSIADGMVATFVSLSDLVAMKRAAGLRRISRTSTGSDPSIGTWRRIMSQADERDERGWDAGWDAHTTALRRRLFRWHRVRKPGRITPMPECLPHA